VGQAERGAAQAAGVDPEVVELEELANEGEWLDLADRHADSSYFQTPDWVLSWWETLAGRPPTRVAAWRADSGELEALVALSRGRERIHRRVPIAVPVYANSGSGAGDADHCGWLAAPRRRAAVAEWVSGSIGGSSLLVRSAAADWSPACLPAGAREVAVTTCPRVPLPLAAATGQPSKDFVRQLRRFTRRLARKGVGFEWVAPPGLDERLLDALFALKPEFFNDTRRAFHRLLAGRAAPGRGPAAVVARRGERVVGMLYGFWWHQTFAAYQHGWDREYARDALGNVLVLHALELAGENGAHSLDFLRGAESYKYRFGAHDRWDRSWLVPRGPGGALLAAAARARRRGRPAAPPPPSG
jgi:CelD/BcsL family acetyltransferase involved in cellulose biosynthesis